MLNVEFLHCRLSLPVLGPLKALGPHLFTPAKAKLFFGSTTVQREDVDGVEIGFRSEVFGWCREHAAGVEVHSMPRTTEVE